MFSDYAVKHRFIKLPPGAGACYEATETFDFPVGTIIAKTLAYPLDLRKPEADERLIETRLLVRRPQGWIGLPYVWNHEQTEATLELAGGTSDVQWVHTDGKPVTTITSSRMPISAKAVTRSTTPWYRSVPRRGI